jgi:hypothetical protein
MFVWLVRQKLGLAVTEEMSKKKRETLGLLL